MVVTELPNPPLAYFSVAWYLILIIIIVAETYWNYIHPPFTKTFSIFVAIEIVFLTSQTCCLCLYAYSNTQNCVIYLLQRFCDIVHILALFLSYCVWGNGYFKNVTYGVKTAWNSLKAPYFILLAMITYDIVSISLSISFVILSGDCTTMVYSNISSAISFLNLTQTFVVICVLIVVLIWFIQYNRKMKVNHESLLGKIYLLFLYCFIVSTFIMFAIFFLKLVLIIVIRFADVSLDYTLYKIFMHHIPDFLQILAELFLTLNMNECFKRVFRLDY